ncbi:hypothetical protein OFY17_13065 [Marinomonas sp. C2222]|uniref:EamA domain-containing protein n=1 Tax=Marinomonas sargassi TaxID=2984494 RepID=A0ABT2YV72_9GAMM|nr:hypothetical protein [Marinomonas sargassi]MCV2403797.1 hypothetical protein [Marinomonas sargassi]
MKLEWRSLVSLKTPVIVAFVLMWNTGFLFAMHLGGGGLKGGLSPIGMKITGFVCLAACFFSISVAASKSVQEVLIAPSRADNFHSKEFYFLAFVSGALAVSRFVFLAIEDSSNAF